MKRVLILLGISALLMGQSCEYVPPEGGTDYCKGNEYSIFDRWGGQIYDTIIGGEESEDRRGTVQVFFGQSYCSGVVISPHTVLTAAHCGYGADTTHRVRADGVEFNSAEKLMHPDYQGWISGSDLEARKADLMLLYVDAELPPPYISDLYVSELSNLCLGLVAQGFGRAEMPKPTEQLREAKYIVTSELPKLIQSVRAPDGKICFGDSGGPLYADVNGTTQLAGITTTTMSADCLLGGTHVKVAAFRDWIGSNTRP